MPRFKFNSLGVDDGSRVQPPHRGVTCIVGANNAGKSQLLKDLVLLARNGRQSNPKLLRSHEESFLVGDALEIHEWVQTRTRPSNGDSSPAARELPNGNMSAPSDYFERRLQEYANSPEEGLDYLTDGFVLRVSAGELGQYVSGPLKMEHPHDTRARSVLERLYVDDGASSILTSLTEKLFSTPVFMDKANFPPRLRAGVVGLDAPPVDSVPREYAEAAAAIPTLDDEGDGLRAFAGLVGIVCVLSPDVLLLDEPEAFLHPGQARAVGRWLIAESVKRGIQVITASHNRDFISGLAEGASSGQLAMARLVRGPSNESQLSTITTDELKTYWSDPVTRYSNTLAGMFYERVVVCEGLDDCCFYNAVADSLAIANGTQSVVDDTLFLAAHGNAGMPEICNALNSIGVKVSAIVDFDTLQRAKLVEDIVRAVGGDWESIAPLHENAAKHVRGLSPNWWEEATSRGLSHVPAGPAHVDFVSLLESLSTCGVHVVRDGALESFDRRHGKGRGHSWLRAALEDSSHLASNVQDFIRDVLPAIVA